MHERRVAVRPDIDCVSGLVPPTLLAAAARRARDIDVGIHRVLAVCGVMSEERYLRAFASSLGVPFESLEDVPRDACPFDDDLIVNAVVAGALPIAIDGNVTYVVVPRALASTWMCEILRKSSDYPHSIRITCESCLAAFVARHVGAAVAERAANALARRYPELSAASTRYDTAAGVTILVMAAVMGMALWPYALRLTAGSLLASTFLAWSGLRLWSVVCGAVLYRPSRRLSDAELPHYTVVAALYDEAEAVESLIAAIDAFDYPPEKLDVKIVVEPDDHDTRAAIAACALRTPYEVIIAPDCRPRTKPKALNASLPFARGEFIAVFDAEDQPEPDQLRAAVSCFRDHGPELACVQARLTINNTCDSWLTRLFTAEYAGLFDVFLPGLARYRMPLPLGGSSNHFAASVLRQVGSWDAHNVTEDADLGMRLARFGYMAMVMESSTWEEAPSRLSPWLKQRTRWFKGWMQTWLVHMRQPVGLWNDLGPRGFVVFQLVVGGSALTALVHPVLLVFVVQALASGEASAFDVVHGFYASAFIVGYLSSIILGLVGLAYRGLLSQSWALVLVPIHWILLSIAAWRAVYKLLARPFEWEKTAHGLAKTWRRPSKPDTGA